ncbi:hypothetical protein D9613_009072 [Agrocybe pediades]|uniref:Uncharacterized protein n=1 Tax=Agrocybe pediades TaxID=84607 RepID=A0A8H4R4T5_9AGAR|nr:hypothetical protein D9613_009072 [Agrocybe pediades]
MQRRPASSYPEIRMRFHPPRPWSSAQLHISKLCSCPARGTQRGSELGMQLGKRSLRTTLYKSRRTTLSGFRIIVLVPRLTLGHMYILMTSARFTSAASFGSLPLLGLICRLAQSFTKPLTSPSTEPWMTLNTVKMTAGQLPYTTLQELRIGVINLDHSHCMPSSYVNQSAESRRTFPILNTNRGPGHLVKYCATASDNESAHTVLAPSQTISVEHNLGQTYNFTNSGEGEYNISPRNIFYVLNADSSISSYEAQTSSHTAKISGALAVS